MVLPHKFPGFFALIFQGNEQRAFVVDGIILISFLNITGNMNFYEPSYPLRLIRYILLDHLSFSFQEADMSLIQLLVEAIGRL